ncbi:hypothetical protein DFH07DRAFT_844050, partial [Mycena maculata]
MQPDEQPCLAGTADAVAAEEMRPVMSHLEYLQNYNKNTSIMEINLTLMDVGRYLEKAVEKRAAWGEDAGEWAGRLWTFAAVFWPAENVDGRRLQQLYLDMGGASKSASEAAAVVAVPESKAPCDPPPPTPASLPEVPVSPVPAAKPALEELLALMQQNTQIIKSASALTSSSSAPPSTRRRTTAQPGHPTTPSTKPKAVERGPAAHPLPEAQSQHGRRSQSATLAKRTNVSPSPPSDPAPPPPSLPQASASRSRPSSVPSGGTPVDVLIGGVPGDVPRPAVIAELRNEYARCCSEASSQRGSNRLWSAEASAAAALIEALTQAHTLTHENDALQATNKLIVPFDADGLQLEGPPMMEDVCAEDGTVVDAEEVVGRTTEETNVVHQEDWNKEASTSTPPTTPSPGPECALPNISLEVEVKQEMISLSLPPGIEIPAEHGRAGGGMLPDGAEVIDLTLDDSDDEDPGISVPRLVVSADSVPPTVPVAGVDTSSPSVDEIAPRDAVCMGDGDELIPDDIAPMDLDTADSEPSPDVESQSGTMGSDTALDSQTTISSAEATAPSGATILVVPSISTPGHFRIDDMDIEYSDVHLTELARRFLPQKRDGQKNSTTNEWGNILAALRLSARSTREPFSAERWRATVNALEAYYERFLVPHGDAVLPLQREEDTGERDIVALGDDTSRASSDRHRAVAGDKSMPTRSSRQAPGSEDRSEMDIIDCAPMVLPTPGHGGPRLAEPSQCRNNLPLLGVKTEEDVPDVELAGATTCVRGLSQAHVEQVFPLVQGVSVVACAWCDAEGEKYEYPYPSPLKVLSTHVEKYHRPLFDVMLDQTTGMTSDEIRQWFQQLDVD